MKIFKNHLIILFLTLNVIQIPHIKSMETGAPSPLQTMQAELKKDPQNIDRKRIFHSLLEFVQEKPIDQNQKEEISKLIFKINDQEVNIIHFIFTYSHNKVTEDNLKDLIHTFRDLFLEKKATQKQRTFWLVLGRFGRDKVNLMKLFAQEFEEKFLTLRELENKEPFPVAPLTYILIERDFQEQTRVAILQQFENKLLDIKTIDDKGNTLFARVCMALLKRNQPKFLQHIVDNVRKNHFLTKNTKTHNTLLYDLLAQAGSYEYPSIEFVSLLVKPFINEIEKHIDINDFRVLKALSRTENLEIIKKYGDQFTKVASDKFFTNAPQDSIKHNLSGLAYTAGSSKTEIMQYILNNFKQDIHINKLRDNDFTFSIFELMIMNNLLQENLKHLQLLEAFKPGSFNINRPMEIEKIEYKSTWLHSTAYFCENPKVIEFLYAKYKGDFTSMADEIGLTPLDYAHYNGEENIKLRAKSIATSENYTAKDIPEILSQIKEKEDKEWQELMEKHKADTTQQKTQEPQEQKTASANLFSALLESLQKRQAALKAKENPVSDIKTALESLKPNLSKLSNTLSKL